MTKRESTTLSSSSLKREEQGSLHQHREILPPAPPVTTKPKSEGEEQAQEPTTLKEYYEAQDMPHTASLMDDFFERDTGWRIPWSVWGEDVADLYAYSELKRAQGDYHEAERILSNLTHSMMVPYHEGMWDAEHLFVPHPLLLQMLKKQRFPTIVLLFDKNEFRADALQSDEYMGEKSSEY